MTEDVKNVLGDVEEVSTKKKPEPPAVVHLRWSKVLNKHVLCLESDHEAIPYKISR